MKYYERGFLNKEEGMAAFEAEVSREEYQEGQGCFDATFSITDCGRKVTLDFYVHNEVSLAKAMYKINKLIAELETFRANLEKFGEDVKEDKIPQ